MLASVSQHGFDTGQVAGSVRSAASVSTERPVLVVSRVASVSKTVGAAGDEDEVIAAPGQAVGIDRRRCRRRRR